ncbi:putative pyruvate formate lyase activating enzyme [Lachnospiraceae bacterium KH1T2]|nr:putative pyruvate formate lyase activating enzyme [Lachnospiraceae bacterium KH1T2]
MSVCNLCPRRCGADRSAPGAPGAYCHSENELKVARAALHFWEEPCISGKEGSGAVFFSGCSMQCVYCQNHDIAKSQRGQVISVERLTDIFYELCDKGANNINLVTPDHYIPQVIKAIKSAKDKGFSLPFLMNCSGYETVEQIKALDGLIDIYLPDFKYMEPDLAAKYSNAPDYPEVAKSAIAEMVRQCSSQVLDRRGIMTRGVIVRHLLLPGHVLNSKKVVRYLYETYGDSITISIMDQYTPIKGIGDDYPELARRCRPSEYERLVDFAINLGVKNAYTQDGSVAKESFIPDFGDQGVLPEK